MHVGVATRRLLLLVPLIGLVAAALGCDPQVRGSFSHTGSRERAATGFDLDGRKMEPLAESSDDVVVLVFVRSDCPISNRYAPELARLASEFASQGAKFYLVYPDPNATAEQIRSHLQEFSLGSPALRDPEHTLVELAQVKVTPEAAVFDRRDRLVYHGRIDDWYVDFGLARSEPTRHDLREAIEAALADAPVPASTTEAIGCFISDLK